VSGAAAEQLSQADVVASATDVTAGKETIHWTTIRTMDKRALSFLDMISLPGVLSSASLRQSCAGII
jgi:hypothetical protein